MDFKKADKIYEKFVHDSRKYAPVLEKLQLKLNDTTLSYKEFFETAFKFELLYSYKGILASKCMLTNGFNYTCFFERRFLETAAILFALKEGKLEESNFKIFKIITQNRKIGEKEGNKFKKEFKINTKKSFDEYCKENPYVFLLGLTSGEPTPIGLIKEIKTNSTEEEKLKQSLLEDYRVNSCLIHFMVSSNNEKSFNSFIDNRYQKDYKILKMYLKDELRDSAKLANPVEDDEDFTYMHESFSLRILACSSELMNQISLEQLNEIFFDPLEYMTITILSYLTSFQKRDYSYTLALPKMFFEKMDIYFELIKSNNYKEIKSRYLSYLYILEKKVQLNNKNISEDEEIVSNIKDIYKEFVDLNITSLNFYDFKRTILRSPSYLIYSTENNFTNLADRFIQRLDTNTNLFKNIYKLSVIYSHSYGASILIHENSLKHISLDIFSIILKTLILYLKDLEDNLVIKLQENYLELNDAINDYIHVIIEFYNHVVSLLKNDKSMEEE